MSLVIKQFQNPLAYLEQGHDLVTKVGDVILKVRGFQKVLLDAAQGLRRICEG